MTRYDLWQREREAADVLDYGIRVQRKDSPPIATIWNPKATKPNAHFRFRDAEQRDAYIARYLTNYAAHLDRVATAKAERKRLAAQHAGDIGPGHIFVWSWGYDQTNVNYFQVTTKRGQLVTVREISQSTVPASAGFMCEQVKPRIGHFLATPAVTKRLQFTPDGRAYLAMEFGWCGLWRGESDYQSHDA